MLGWWFRGAFPHGASGGVEGFRTAQAFGA